MSEEPFDELVEQLPVRERSAAEVDELVHAVQRGLLRRQRRARRSLLVAAALLACATTWATLQVARLAPGERASTEPPPSTPPAELRAETGDDRVWAEAGSVYSLHGPDADRVVLLEAGRLSCAVAHRRAGERFRVLVGGDEVEVVGTRFEVVAEDDALLAVAVHEGEVVLRLQGGEVRRLRRGQRWTAAEPEEQGASPAGEDEQASAARPPRPRARREADLAATAPRAAAEALFAEGLARYDAEDFAGAYRRFSQVDSGPLRADAQFWAALSQLRRGAGGDGIEVLRRALEGGVPPERRGLLSCLLGQRLQLAGRVEEAARAFAEAAVDADPAVAACGAEGGSAP